MGWTRVLRGSVETNSRLKCEVRRSKLECCVRAYSNEFEHIVSRLPVDENKVTAQVTVPTILELALHRVIVKTWRQPCIGREHVKSLGQGVMDMVSVLTLFQTFNVAAKLLSAVDPPHWTPSCAERARCWSAMLVSVFTKPERSKRRMVSLPPRFSPGRRRIKSRVSRD